MRGEQIPSPGQGRCGRLVTREHERHHLVAHVVVAERRVAVVAFGQQQRDDVAAAGDAALRDDRRDDRFEFAPFAGEKQRSADAGSGGGTPR